MAQKDAVKKDKTGKKPFETFTSVEVEVVVTMFSTTKKVDKRDLALNPKSKKGTKKRWSNNQWEMMFYMEVGFYPDASYQKKKRRK